MDVKAFSKDIVIDIPDEAFQAGRRLREHKTFERFTRDNVLFGADWKGRSGDA